MNSTLFGAVSLLLISAISAPAWGQAGTTKVVSVNNAGAQANDRNQTDGISADGRYVVFRSSATNLAPGVGDNGNSRHVYVRDRDVDGDGVFDEPGDVKTIIVSVSSSGEYGNQPSAAGKISADGRFVAFESGSTNLDPAGNGGRRPLIFLHDRDADADGVFDEPGEISTKSISATASGGSPNNNSFGPSISASGRYVAYWSNATNLTPDDDANGSSGDVFVFDQETGSTARVSIASDGIQGNSASWFPSISGGGRFVAFASNATNLVPGEDANGDTFDVFVHDRDTDEDGIFDETDSVSTERVSNSTSGEQGNNRSLGQTISSSGRYVVYYSYATNLHPSMDPDGNGPYVIVRDRLAGTTALVSEDRNGPPNSFGPVWQPQISDNGRYVAFISADAELIPGGDANGRTKDVFVHDRDTDQDGIFDEPGKTATEVFNISSTGEQGNADGLTPRMSADGRHAAFTSFSTNLIAGGDDNGDVPDVLVHDRGAPRQAPTAVCRDRRVATEPGLCLAEVSVDDGSSDPEGASVTLDQTPPGPYGLGLTEVVLTVTNDADLSDMCRADVSVFDGQLPDVTCPAPQKLECTGPSGAVGSYSFSSADKCGVTASGCDIPSGSTFALGTTDVACMAVDGSHNQGSCSFAVTVVDTIAPTVTAKLTPISRWGHHGDNHDGRRNRWRGRGNGLYRVSFAAADSCDFSAPVTAVLDATGLPAPIPVTDGQIVKIEFDDDEAETKRKRGILTIEARAVTLRATATDASGNSATAEAQAKLRRRKHYSHWFEHYSRRYDDDHRRFGNNRRGRSERDDDD